MPNTGVTLVGDWAVGPMLLGAKAESARPTHTSAASEMRKKCRLSGGHLIEFRNSGMMVFCGFIFLLSLRVASAQSVSASLDSPVCRKIRQVGKPVVGIDTAAA